MKVEKGTRDFEADSRIGVDSARSFLKGNGRMLDNLECEHEAHGDPKIERGHAMWNLEAWWCARGPERACE